MVPFLLAEGGFTRAAGSRQGSPLRVTVPDGTRGCVSVGPEQCISRDAIRTSFLPVIIDRQLRPEILRASDPRFEDVVRYMEWASEGFDHCFAVDGNEITISG